MGSVGLFSLPYAKEHCEIREAGENRPTEPIEPTLRSFRLSSGRDPLRQYRHA